jgi:hypothetical protein
VPQKKNKEVLGGKKTINNKLRGKMRSAKQDANKG